MHKVWSAFRTKRSQVDAMPLAQRSVFAPLLLRFIARTYSAFPAVGDCSASVTPVRPFRNISIHSYTVGYGLTVQVFFYVFRHVSPSDDKHRITAHHSLVHKVSGLAMLTLSTHYSNMAVRKQKYKHFAGTF